MALKVLIKRDSTKNFTIDNFVPREHELVSAYEQDSKRVIYKFGDGKTSWENLPEVTKISEIDRFKVYTRRSGTETIEMFLNPLSIEEFLKKGSDESEQENSNIKM